MTVSIKKRRAQKRMAQRRWQKKHPLRQNALNRAYQVRRRDWVRSLKKECTVCGESDPRCLDFHHKNPSDKIKPVGAMIGLAKQKVLAEIAKCVVVCANCHRKLHRTI